MTPPALLARPGTLPLLALGLSLLVSLWLMAIDPVMGNDSVLYLVAAEVFVADGFRASVDIYHWPFLQMLIGAIHAATGLAPVHAGLLVTTLCYALLAVAFARVVRELGGNTVTQLLAVIIVVFNAPLADGRSAIGRDAGMLAFMLLGLVELIRYGRNGAWRHALQWTLCMVLAFLFRVETLALALLTPFGLLFLGETPWRQRLARLGTLLALPGAVLLASMAGLLLLAADLLPTLKVTMDLEQIGGPAWRFSERLAAMSEQLAASGLLRHTAVNDALWGVMAVMLTLFVLNLVRALTVPYVAVLAWQWWKGPPLRLCPVGQRLIVAHLAVIATYQLALIFAYQFSLKRYLLHMAILLLLLVPFVLARWWQRAPRHSLARFVIALLLLGQAADTLINSRHQKAYIAEAADWLRDATLAQDIKVVSNDHHLAYFSGRVARQDILLSRQTEEFDKAHTPWQRGMLYAYRTPRRADIDTLRRDIHSRNGEILAEWPGGDGRQVVIFQLPRE